MATLERRRRRWKQGHLGVPAGRKGGGRMGVCQAARLCRKLPTRGVGPALLQRMRVEEVKEEEGGVINPSRPWVRWPIC